jgi:hypothetical protein
MATRKAKDSGVTKSNFSQFIEALRANDEEAASAAVKNELSDLIINSGLSDYKILFLHDDFDSISNYHANKLYSASSDLKQNPKTFF